MAMNRYGSTDNPISTRQLCYNQAVKKELMEILACPVCKGELELSIDKENKQEIVSGTLYCRMCNHRYPIEDTIPNLLPPEKVS